MDRKPRKTYDEMIWRLLRSPLYRRCLYAEQRQLVAMVKRVYLSK